MSTLGIVAEFNPFHNGHLHLIKESRKKNHVSSIICVISGNFMQRGEIAICNKWVRAEMALKAGADLVIELPFCFAVRSAYHFARGSIELLHRTGIVSHLAFGSESGNLEILQSISELVASEPKQYKELLKKHLSQGLSFPAARSKTIQSLSASKDYDIENVLLQANNILAIEYLRVILNESIPIKPFTITRIGSSYDSNDISSYASAKAIRTALSNQQIDKISSSMPVTSLSLLKQEIKAGHAPVFIDSLEQLMLFKLRMTSLQKLRNIYEINEGLEHKIQQAALSSSNLKELTQNIKSKRYSLTRINRILLYTLFDLTSTQIKVFDEYGPLYLHILGFSAQGQKLLQEIKNKSTLPILNRGSDVKSIYQDKSNRVRAEMIGLDIKATDVYTLLYPDSTSRKGALDFTTSPIKISDE